MSEQEPFFWQPTFRLVRSFVASCEKVLVEQADVDNGGRRGAAFKALMPILDCRELPDDRIDDIRAGLTFFNGTDDFWCKELRSDVGEKLKGVAWKVYSERSKDVRLFTAAQQRRAALRHGSFRSCRHTRQDM